MSAFKKRTRRTPEQLIAELKAKIAEIEERKERKQAMKDPALRHVAAAMRSVEKAMAEATVPTMRQSLAEARERLASCATTGGENGVVLIPQRRGPGRPRKTPVLDDADSEAVMRYVRNNPGARCSDVAAELNVESSAVSPVLKALLEGGKLEREGQARGTKYYVAQ